MNGWMLINYLKYGSQRLINDEGTIRIVLDEISSKTTIKIESQSKSPWGRQCFSTEGDIISILHSAILLQLICALPHYFFKHIKGMPYFLFIITNI